MPLSRNIYTGLLTLFINVLLLLIIVATLRDLKTPDKSPGTAVSNPATAIEKPTAASKLANESRAIVVSSPAAEIERPVLAPAPTGKSQSAWVSGTTAEIEKQAVTPAPVEDSQSTWMSGTTAEIEKQVVVAPNSVQVRVSLWNHNGSVLRLQAVGRSRRFYYVEPGAGLPAKSGDMVFEGVREGLTYSGRSFHFSEKCTPIAYHVKGSVSPDETTVKMRGRRPRSDAQCHIVSYVDEELVFNATEKL